MYICMYTSIHVDIPSANEGMNVWLPKVGLEKIIRMFREWVEEHNTLGPQEEISITAWGPGDKWRYTMESSVAGFADDIEYAINAITVLSGVR